jgi:hypothetical protein
MLMFHFSVGLQDADAHRILTLVRLVVILKCESIFSRCLILHYSRDIVDSFGIGSRVTNEWLSLVRN